MAGIWYMNPSGPGKDFYNPLPPPYDIDTTLRVVGFSRSPSRPGRWQLVLDDIQVTAGADCSAVLFCAQRITKRQIGSMEMLAPLRLTVQHAAHVIACVYRQFHPDCIPKEVAWATQKVQQIRYAQPWMRVPRSHFRDLLKRFTQSEQIDEGQAAHIWFGRQQSLLDADALCIRIGTHTLTLPAFGAWVGVSMVNARDLLSLLSSRFRWREIRISASADRLKVGHKCHPARWVDAATPDNDQSIREGV